MLLLLGAVLLGCRTTAVKNSDRGEVEIASTYILLVRFTPGGFLTLRVNPPERQVVERVLHRYGAELKHLYLVSGEYDMVIICEAPDNRTIGKVLLGLDAIGEARTEALLAFTAEQYVELINQCR